MNNRVIVSSCAAAMLSLGIAAAQTTTQTPTQSPVQGTTQGTTGQTRPTTGVTNEKPITVTGCVMRETDYTKERGGALNTGIGAGNEYVLANAMTGAATRSAAEPSSRGDAGAPGVSGSTSSGREPSSVGTSGSGTSSGAGNPDASAGAGRPSTTTGQTEPGGTNRQDTTASRAATSGTAYMLTGPREGDLSAHVGKRVEIMGTIEDDASPSPTGTSGQARTGAAEMKELRIASFREVPGTCQ